MVLDYTTKGKVRIDMRQYISKILQELEHLKDGWEGKAITPATENLFKIDDNAKKLEKTVSESFHHVVAQLFFYVNELIPYIQTAVAYLTTRVKQPDVDDLQKLKRTICYLCGSQELVLTLESNNSAIINWWVDAAFGVHQDMKSRIVFMQRRRNKKSTLRAPLRPN